MEDYSDIKRENKKLKKNIAKPTKKTNEKDRESIIEVFQEKKKLKREITLTLEL